MLTSMAQQVTHVGLNKFNQTIILKCNAHTGRCTFLFLSLSPTIHKTFFVNFLEVTEEKRIFAASIKTNKK